MASNLFNVRSIYFSPFRYDTLKVRPGLRRGVNVGKKKQPVSSSIVQADDEGIKRLFIQNRNTGVGGGTAADGGAGGGGGDLSSSKL